MAILRRLLADHQGFNLVEIIAASVIGALLAGGAMTAFVMSVKTSQQASGKTEAVQLAQQTIEKFRNQIACNSSWFKPTDCEPGTLPSNEGDPLPPTSVLPMFGGSRNYTVTEEDCDGVGGPGDCLKVTTTVTWAPSE